MRKNSMEYKAIISGKEYPLPKGIYELNEEKLKKYSYEDEEYVYVDIDRLKNEEDYRTIDIISFQCAGMIGEMVLDDERALSEYNKLGPKVRFLDDMAKYNKENGKMDKAKNNLSDAMALILEFYRKELELEENRINQNKSSR